MTTNTHSSDLEEARYEYNKAFNALYLELAPEIVRDVKRVADTLIAVERQKALTNLIEKANHVGVSTKYIAEHPPREGKSYTVVGVALLKHLAEEIGEGN